MDLALKTQNSSESNQAMGSAQKDHEAAAATPKANLRQERITNTRPQLKTMMSNVASLTTIPEDESAFSH